MQATAPMRDPGTENSLDTSEAVGPTESARSRHGRLLDNLGALFLRQLAIWSFSFVIVLFVPRYLGDEGLGRITFATAVLMVLVMVSGLGSESYVVKAIAKDRERAASLLWSAYVVRLTVGLASVALIALTLQVVPMDADLRGVLYVTSITVVVMSLKEAQAAVILGLERMRWLSVAEILHKGTVMGLGVGLLIAGYGVVVYAAAVLSGAIVGLLVTTAFLLPLHRRVPRLGRADLTLFLRGSMPFFLIGVSLQVYHWVDVAMLMALTADAVVGWYGAAIQLYTTINVLPLILSMALLPALSQLRPDSEELRRTARAGLAAVMLTAVPMTVALVLLSDRIIGFLGYPGEFANTVPLLAILAVQLPLTGMLMVLATIVISVDRQSTWARIIVLSLVLNLALNVVLIPVTHNVWGNGAIGAAIASVAAELFQLCLGLRLIPKGILEFSLLRTLGKVAVASTAMAATVAFAGANGLSLVLLVPMGGAAYAAAILLVRGVTLHDLKDGVRAWSNRRMPEVATGHPQGSLTGEPIHP